MSALRRAAATCWGLIKLGARFYLLVMAGWGVYLGVQDGAVWLALCVPLVVYAAYLGWQGYRTPSAEPTA